MMKPKASPADAGRDVRADLLAAFVVLFALYLAGCSAEDGPLRVPVSGAVLLGGQPLKSGQIRFIPTGATTGPAAATAIVDGKYRFTNEDGPIVGEHRVEIEATDYLGFPIDDERAFAAFMQTRRAHPRRRIRNPVPECYNVRSTLTRTVAAEIDLRLDFDLSPTGTSGTL